MLPQRDNGMHHTSTLMPRDKIDLATLRGMDNPLRFKAIRGRVVWRKTGGSFIGTALELAMLVPQPSPCQRGTIRQRNLGDHASHNLLV
jgi:hypothetical protein